MATTTPIAEGPTPGTPWTLESLVQAAQQIVQAQGQEGREDKSPEKTRPEVKTLVVKDIRISSLHSASSALLDSGATHNLRSAYDQEEWEKAENVVVQLAGSNKLTMKMSETGTLLMPPRATSLGSSEAATGGRTIVSMGELVRTLGYTLVWAPERCVLQTPQGDEVQLNVHGGCPQLCEAEALAIIARLEERKRERLLNEVTATQDRIEMAGLAMDRGGMDHLRDYVEGGSMEAGLRSIRDVCFLQGLPGECVDGLLQSGVREQGWGVMKNISFLTRAQKRYLWGAKRWVIHLFAGDYGHYKVFQLDQGSTAVIELDVHRCKGHDILSENTWRFLLWGALTGRIDAVIGGPPARSGVVQPTGKTGPDALRAMKLITRMMWLFTLAKMSREYRTDALNRQRPVAFMMEHPATESSKRTSVWATELWREFKSEMDMMEVTFNQRATGGGDVPTTIGTNVYYLLGLDNLGRENLEGEVGVSKDGGIWSSGLVDAIVLALTFWDKHPRCCPVLASMSPEQWRRHIQSNHADYHRDCLTCVMARGTGRRHARARHPDMFNLTVDLAGPVRPGLDPTSKGTMGKGLKYMLVAKYVFPSEYVKGYTGREPPDDHGMGGKGDAGDPGQQLETGNNGQGEPPTLQSSDEQVLEDLKRIPLPSEEEQGGNPTHHPLQEEDPFELDPVEQLEEEEESLHSQEPPGRDEGFVGSTKTQREDYTGPEDFAYEPSLQEEEEQQHQVELEEDDDEPLQEERCHDNGFPDSCAPEAMHLIFARALPTNGSGVVKAAIQDIVLYLQARGLMVYRLHADMGEVYCHQIRGWLRDQGIRATFSEPSKPQQNGLAEATGRWVKDQTRTLLLSAKLPTRLWPTAAEAATAIQRNKILGGPTKLIAPYGAPVVVKQKVVDSSGPRRREKAFESKWARGRYVGLSGVLDRGHLVYLPPDGDKKEKFIHTLHVRAGLVDPGVPVMKGGVEPPKPRRKLVEKTPISQVDMRPVNLSQEELRGYISSRSQQLIENWSQEEALQFVDELAERRIFDETKFGIYRHGGTVGWLMGFQEYPELSQVLASIVTYYNPEATFTAIWAARDMEKGMHRDFNNDEEAMNYVVPIRVPKSGGDLWVELELGDRVKGEVLDRVDDKGRKRYGQVYKVKKGACNVFSPRKLHEVLPWEGHRTMLIAYTPQGLGKISNEMIRQLEDHGFPPPITQYPEYFVMQEARQPWVGKQLVVDQPEEEFQGPEIEDEDVEEWEMFLDTGFGFLKKNPESLQMYMCPRLRRTSPRE